MSPTVGGIDYHSHKKLRELYIVRSYVGFGVAKPDIYGMREREKER
jgi:hypothetical protein